MPWWVHNLRLKTTIFVLGDLIEVLVVTLPLICHKLPVSPSPQESILEVLEGRPSFMVLRMLVPYLSFLTIQLPGRMLSVKPKNTHKAPELSDILCPLTKK